MINDTIPLNERTTDELILAGLQAGDPFALCALAMRARPQDYVPAKRSEDEA